MSKRVALALAVLVAAGIAAFAGVGPAAAIAVVCDCGTPTQTDPTSLSPADATALAAAPGSGGLSAPTAANPADVLAAASAPGADTQIEPDLTAKEAVGLAPGGASLGTTTSQARCWADQAWYQWGTWPYQQRITDTTYWCAKYGVKITLRTSDVAGGGTICGMSWRSSQVIGGGVDFPFFTERSTAGYSCPTVIPWIVLHPSHHLDVLRDSRGGAQIVGHG